VKPTPALITLLPEKLASIRPPQDLSDLPGACFYLKGLPQKAAAAPRQDLLRLAAVTDANPRVTLASSLGALSGGAPQPVNNRGVTAIRVKIFFIISLPP